MDPHNNSSHRSARDLPRDWHISNVGSEKWDRGTRLLNVIIMKMIDCFNTAHLWDGWVGERRSHQLIVERGCYYPQCKD